MRIYTNQANFLIGLFEDYEEKVYIHMRKNGYEMKDIMSFINGYQLVVEKCYEYVIDYEARIGMDASKKFKSIIFYDEKDMLKEFNHSILNVLYGHVKLNDDFCNKWENIGIYYAIVLVRFYIKEVLSGKDDCVEVDELYINIPNKKDPDTYDWAIRILGE